MGHRGLPSRGGVVYTACCQSGEHSCNLAGFDLEKFSCANQDSGHKAGWPQLWVQGE